MEVSIKDGFKGTQKEAFVDGDGRVHVFSIVEPEEKHVNREGRTWSLHLIETPAGANDSFMYLRNDSDTDLVLTDVRLLAASPETIYVKKATGTPTYVTGTDISPSTRNLGSSLTPGAEIKHDTNITGLTLGDPIFFIRAHTANRSEHLKTFSNVIIPRGSAFVLEAVTGGIQLECAVTLSVLDEEGV